MSEDDLVSEAEITVGKDLVIFLFSSFALFGFYQLLIERESGKVLLASLLLAGLGGYATVIANAMTNDDHKIVREHGRNGFLKVFAGLVYYIVIGGVIVIAYAAVGSLG